MIFQLENGGSVDVVDFTNSILIQHPDTKIYVGCDSQDRQRRCKYALVIAYRFTYGESGTRKGARYIYQEEWVDKQKSKEVRLWGEAERSVELAKWLRGQGFEVYKIDLDFNHRSNTGSHDLVASGMGYCKQFGFDSSCKPDEQVASRAGDRIVKEKHKKKKKKHFVRKRKK